VGFGLLNLGYRLCIQPEKQKTQPT